MNMLHFGAAEAISPKPFADHVIDRGGPSPWSDVDISKNEENHEHDNEDARDAKSTRAVCAAVVVVAAASK